MEKKKYAIPHDKVSHCKIIRSEQSEGALEESLEFQISDTNRRFFIEFSENKFQIIDEASGVDLIGFYLMDEEVALELYSHVKSEAVKGIESILEQL